MRAHFQNVPIILQQTNCYIFSSVSLSFYMNMYIKHTMVDIFKMLCVQTRQPLICLSFMKIRAMATAGNKHVAQEYVLQSFCITMIHSSSNYEN